MKKISMRKAKNLPEGTTVAFKIGGSIVSGARVQSQEKRDEIRQRVDSVPVLRVLKVVGLGVARAVGLELYVAEFIPVEMDVVIHGTGDYLYSKDGKSYQKVPKDFDVIDFAGYEFVRVV